MKTLKRLITFTLMGFDILIYKILHINEEFVSVSDSRSDSDNGKYLIAVRGALNS